METRWMYVTSKELETLREESKGVCVIPMGCVEKHGAHLPLGTDVIQAVGIANAASQMETFTVFPEFAFGDFPINSPNRPTGSVTLRLETEIALLEELLEQISRNGYKKILVYNYHGGNISWLEAFLRKMGNKKHDFVFGYVYCRSPLPHKLAEYLLENGRGSIPELTKEDEDYILDAHERKVAGGHGCLSETANVLVLAPDSVHQDRACTEDGISRHYTEYLRKAGIHIAAGGWDVDYPNNFSGSEVEMANERMGKANVRFEAEYLANAVRVLKNDTNWLEKWHEQYWI